MNKTKSNPVHRLSRRLFGWLLGIGFVFGVYRLYRWAEPSPASLAAVTSPSRVNSINLELEEAAFENFADGAKNWSIWAGRILLDRPAGGVPNTLQSAEIEDLRDGKLFAAPMKSGKTGHSGSRREEGTALQPTSDAQPSALTQSEADASGGVPSATFSAQHGHYVAGNAEGLPSDMLLTYTVRWQFRLTGDVKIRTQEGYRLNAPAITMVELFNRRTGKTERQMLCDQGARVHAKGADMQANQARYIETSQTVECVGGVRGTLQKDSIQADAMHWSLKDNVIRCPESASGVWQNTPFTATNLVVDIKHHRYTGTEIDLQLSQEKILHGALP